MEQHLNFCQNKIDSYQSGDTKAKSGAPYTQCLSLLAKGEPFSEQSVNFSSNAGPKIQQLCSISDEKRYPEKPPQNQQRSSCLNEDLHHTCVCG